MKWIQNPRRIWRLAAVGFLVEPGAPCGSGFGRPVE